MAGTMYDFRSGRSYKNLDPQEIGNELERIRSDRGVLKPADVVAEARAEESPLHDAFEWDDSKAAEQHRLNQARRLIVSVRVLNGAAQTRVPAFVSVRTPEHGRTYMPTHEAMSSDHLRARILIEIRTFIESMERRYAHFAEVGEVLGNLKKQVG